MSRRPLTVSFLLPGAGREPVGGFKVVYEYANGLVARGHAVGVVHAAQVERSPSGTAHLRRTGSFLARKAGRAYGPRSWFRLDSRVRVDWVADLKPANIPDGDAVVATAWQTAEWVAKYPPSKGRKLYLIQHQETWAGPRERVMDTWKLPLEKVVISRWLHSIAASLGERSVYIPNGLDFEAFRVDTPPQDRRPDSILMLHHTQPWKGTGDGISALETVRRSHPAALIQLFGTGHAPSELPPGFQYHRNPPQDLLRALYNQSAIFLAPSLAEGWGLPPAEAMMSGCALVATDIGGHREYAVPEETALLSPPGDPDALARSVVRLIGDSQLRVRLATAGRSLIERFTWTRAVDAFEQVLCDAS